MTRAELREGILELQRILVTAKDRRLWDKYKERLRKVAEAYNERFHSDELLDDTQLIDCGVGGESFVLLREAMYQDVPDAFPKKGKPKIRGISAGTALFNPDLVE